jgi:hypothetical protein
VRLGLAVSLIAHFALRKFAKNQTATMSTSNIAPVVAPTPSVSVDAIVDAAVKAGVLNPGKHQFQRYLALIVKRCNT